MKPLTNTQQQTDNSETTGAEQSWADEPMPIVPETVNAVTGMPSSCVWKKQKKELEGGEAGGVS